MWQYTEEDTAQRKPRGHWILSGGAPSSAHLFRALAAQAAALISKQLQAEPWRDWLDELRREGYSQKQQARRVSWRQMKSIAEASGHSLLPPGFENERIEQVFKSSADFCYVRSITSGAPTAKVIAPGDGDADAVEVWYGERKMEDLPRLRGRGKHRVDGLPAHHRLVGA